MSAPTRPVRLTIEDDNPTRNSPDLVPLHWRRGRTDADGVKRDYAYVRVGGATVSFYPGQTGETLEIRTQMEGHRLVPHGYSNHESGDVLYVRYIDPAEHNAPAVRAFLAKVTAAALRAIRRSAGART